MLKSKRFTRNKQYGGADDQRKQKKIYGKLVAS